VGAETRLCRGSHRVRLVTEQGRAMDIFRVHQELIDDYRSFTTSAIAPLDPRISQYVQDELTEGKQWPQPWLSLNPMFASWRLDRRVGHREAAAPGMLEDLSTEARPGRRRYPPRRIVEQVEIAALEYVDWFQPPPALPGLWRHNSRRTRTSALPSTSCPHRGRSLNRVTLRTRPGASRRHRTAGRPGSSTPPARAVKILPLNALGVGGTDAVRQ
jgi:hypothetical protein